ncbi:MAG: hypothetical protein WCJ19_04790 [bacterium]
MDVLLVITIIFIVSICVLLYISFYMWLRTYRRNVYEQKGLETTIYEVSIPRDNEIDVIAAEQMYAGISSIYKSGKINSSIQKIQDFVSIEIVGFPEVIKFYIVCPTKHEMLIQKLIHGVYPSAEVKMTKEYNIFAEGSYVEFAEFKLSKENYYPIRTHEGFKADSLGLITSVLARFRQGESGVVQIVISPADPKWQKIGRKYLSSVEKNNSDPEKGKISLPQDVSQGIDKKIGKLGFNTVIRLISVAQSKDEAKTYLQNMAGAFEQYTSPQMNKFKKKKIKFFAKRDFMYDFLYRFPHYWGKPSILNTEELAAIFHFPNKNVTTPHISWLNSKRAAADDSVPTEGGLWIGRSIFRGVEKNVHILPDDRRRHMYIIGQTGAGKSRFLQMMALQDIRAGRGIAFIDPHHDSIEWLLERIPAERIEDVIYWNPADMERPFGLNILDHRDENDKHRVVAAFYKMLQKLFDPNNQGITGPQLERAIRNCMLTAMAKPGNSMMEVLRLLLGEQPFIDEMMKYLKDEYVKKYWTEQMAKTSDYHKSETLGYFASKLDRFVIDLMMRNMLCQSSSSFDLRKVMDEGKILLMDFSKGMMGSENSEFLGLLMVPRILSAAMSRVDIPMSERRDFYLYVDEFQNFATEDFATILSEARKFRLNLIVAHQFIGQLTDKIKDAVFGNVGTLNVFRVGAEDAKFLTPQFAPIFDEKDLVNVENLNSYIKLLVGGVYPPPFSVNSSYKDPPANPNVRDAIIQLSRLKYGRDREAVEAEINARGIVKPEDLSSKDDTAFAPRLNTL